MPKDPTPSAPRELQATIVALRAELAEHKRLAQELAASTARTNAILEVALDGIITIDETGTIESVNSAVGRMFGYKPTELIGRNVKVLMPSPYREEHDGYLSHYRQTGLRRIIGIGREVEGRRKDGTSFPLELAVSEGFVGDRRFFAGVLHDISDQREADAERRSAEKRAHEAERLASLVTLTAGIAHDIGTPMNIILGYAQMLQRSAEQPEDQARLGIITDQVKRITDLVQTLLNMARPHDVTLLPLELEPLLEHGLAFFQEKLKKRGITVERELQSVPAIHGDRDRLDQVFLNLFVNAADAMPEGGTLRVQLSAQGPTHIEVRISDTGVGIPEEVQGRIFEPFVTTKERGHGTGLGLVVTRGIVVDHGGTIELLRSAPGQGTEFCIRLPVGGQPATHDESS